MKKAYRHGDVIIIAEAKIPQAAKRLPHLVLAEGEVTGHKHEVIGDATLCEIGGEVYLSIQGDDVVVRHEEHLPIQLPKGDYHIRIQREYEPSGWRNVID